MKHQNVSEKPSFFERVGSGLDKVISVFNPYAAYRRTAYRTAGRIMAGSYKGAGSTRLRQDWFPGGKSADEDLLPDLAKLRERSRDLNRNDAHAAGITSTMVTNTVGAGIQMQSRIDNKALGITEEKAKELRDIAEKIWEKWCKQADAGERMDFWEVQTLVDRQILENGEAFLQPVMIDTPFREYFLALDNIEADRVDTPSDKRGNKKIRNGIELGDRGEPISYWVKKSHPGDLTVASGFKTDDFVNIPSRNASGRKNILHIYPVLRAGQTRGVPFFAPVLNFFKDLSDYFEAELVAAKVAACFAIFIKTAGNAMDLAIGQTAGTNAAGQREMEMEPGMVKVLNSGEEIQTANPNRPGSMFEPFVDRVLRAIATGINLPYEIVAKDFSKTNYSSARAALLQAYRYFRMRQQFLANHLCQPTYEMVLEEAWLRGEFPVKDFYSQRHEYTRAKWISSGWQWVDPLKEAMASDLLISKGISTLAEECASQGKDWEETLEQRARELEKIKALEEKYGIMMIQNAAKSKTNTPAAAPELKDPNPKGTPDEEDQ